MKDLDLARPEAPSVMVVDAGDVFVGGRYHSLVPILREVGISCYMDGENIVKYFFENI